VGFVRPHFSFSHSVNHPFLCFVSSSSTIWCAFAATTGSAWNLSPLHICAKEQCVFDWWQREGPKKAQRKGDAGPPSTTALEAKCTSLIFYLSQQWPLSMTLGSFCPNTKVGWLRGASCDGKEKSPGPYWRDVGCGGPYHQKRERGKQTCESEDRRRLFGQGAHHQRAQSKHKSHKKGKASTFDTLKVWYQPI
jgi:hypothetical protein